MNELQKSQATKILACYNLPKNDLEKGGEGSRGGHVIGHTQSGKAIYDDYHSYNYKDFDKQDHLDAADLHNNKSIKYDKMAKEKYNSNKNKEAYDLYNLSDEHDSKASDHLYDSNEEERLKRKEELEQLEIKKNKKIGKTSSGKDIYKIFNHPEHKDFTIRDHKDAAYLLKNKIGSGNSSSKNDDKFNQMQQHAKAAGFSRIDGGLRYHAYTGNPSGTLEEDYKNGKVL